jgi:hypothetical protein
MIDSFEPLPKPGQILLYVDCTQLTHLSVAECLSLLKQNGYSPNLRHSVSSEGDIKLYAVLRDEVITSNTPRDYLADEWEKLVQMFMPDHRAVRSPRSLPIKSSVAA